MQLRQLLDQIEDLKKTYPDIEDWDVFVETEKYTIGTKYIHQDDDEILQHNDKVLKEINDAKQAGWKFIECPTYNSKGELMAVDYYKEVAGGLGLDVDSRSVCVCINY